ncbi:MAG: hypothetical protein QM743_00265 [Chitinophagaceae bacterium]
MPFDKSQLKEMLVPELIDMMQRLHIPMAAVSDKQSLINAILEHQGDSAPAEQADAGEGTEKSAGPEKPVMQTLMQPHWKLRLPHPKLRTQQLRRSMKLKHKPKRQKQQMTKTAKEPAARELSATAPKLLSALLKKR